MTSIQQAFALPTGDRWIGCDFHLENYDVAGSLATIDVNLNMITQVGKRFYVPVEIGIAYEDAAWGLFYVEPVSA